MKTVFKNKPFFYLLISFIIILILWNAYVGISNSNFWALLPVIIELVLLVMIFTGDKYARITIIIWTIIASIVAPALQLLAGFFDIGNDILDNTTTRMSVGTLVYTLVQLAIGILILDYTRRTVKVEKPGDNLEGIQS